MYVYIFGGNFKYNTYVLNFRNSKVVFKSIYMRSKLWILIYFISYRLDLTNSIFITNKQCTLQVSDHFLSENNVIQMFNKNQNLHIKKMFFRSATYPGESIG